MIAFEPTDILFGRGPACYNQPGNKIFRKVIKLYSIHYQNEIPKVMKRACINKIWEELVVLGCRFLFQSVGKNDCWLVASEDIAKRKISHALRDSRSRPLDKDYLQEERVTKTNNITRARKNNQKTKAKARRETELSSRYIFHENRFPQQLLQVQQGLSCDSDSTNNDFMTVRSMNVEGRNHCLENIID
jgi:hypothetical protein